MSLSHTRTHTLTLTNTLTPLLFSCLPQTLITIVTRVALGYNLYTLSREASMCITALLEFVPEGDWEASREWLVTHLQDIATHHHDLVFVVQLLPSTPRGHSLALHLAANLMKRLAGSLSPTWTYDGLLITPSVSF